jgi:hypothetical protein
LALDALAIAAARTSAANAKSFKLRPEPLKGRDRFAT